MGGISRGSAQLGALVAQGSTFAPNLLATPLRLPGAIAQTSVWLQSSPKSLCLSGLGQRSAAAPEVPQSGNKRIEGDSVVSVTRHRLGSLGGNQIRRPFIPSHPPVLPLQLGWAPAFGSSPWAISGCSCVPCGSELW